MPTITTPRLSPPEPATWTAETVSQAFLPALQPGGLAESLGFEGFADQAVVDVGAGDGRYTRLLTGLGARSVTAVELHQCFIDTGRQKGWFAGQAICGDVVSLSELDEHTGTYDRAVITNLTPNTYYRDVNPILKATQRLLNNDGQIVVTLVERQRQASVVEDLSKLFAEVSCSKVWSGFGRPMPANNVMLVAKHKIPVA